MVTDTSPERLADLLREPKEDLAREIKNWLDLKSNEDHKAKFAKAVLALANHGGGTICFGMEPDGHGFREASGRPANFTGFDENLVNGIVRRYCDPPFHCPVYIVSNPAGVEFPMVVVPGGHRGPVLSCRASPNGKDVRDRAIYMRKLGPKSEMPQSSAEWRELTERWVANRRDEMAEQFRNILLGNTASGVSASSSSALDSWIKACVGRWLELSGKLPPDSAARCPNGYYWLAYQITGNLRAVTSAELLQVVRDSEVHHTGWPPFLFGDRQETKPYALDNSVECWLGNDPDTSYLDAAHSDFWRISRDGFAFLLRGYQEDGFSAGGMGRPTISPGTCFDIALPIWRIGETILHAEKLARNLADLSATITFVGKYHGLVGRKLDSLEGNRILSGRNVARQNDIRVEGSFAADRIGPNLPEIVSPMLEPLYGLFNFFEPPKAIYIQELERLRKGNY